MIDGRLLTRLDALLATAPVQSALDVDLRRVVQVHEVRVAALGLANARRRAAPPVQEAVRRAARQEEGCEVRAAGGEIVNVVARKGLKDRLDKIDRWVLETGGDKVVALWQLEKHGMWKKGREVLRAYPDLEERSTVKGGPGGLTVTFTQVESETGRARQTISGWVKLFLAHEDEKSFLEWAKEQAPKVLAKVESSAEA